MRLNIFDFTDNLYTPLKHLSELDRAILFFIAEDMPYKEIAFELNIPRDRVHNGLKRARKKMIPAILLSSKTNK